MIVATPSVASSVDTFVSGMMATASLTGVATVPPSISSSSVDPSSTRASSSEIVVCDSSSVVSSVPTLPTPLPSNVALMIIITHQLLFCLF